MSDIVQEEAAVATETGLETNAAEAVLKERERQSAENTVKNHAITAMGVGILPIPGLDLLALTTVQLSLLRKLSELYGFTLTDELGRKLLSAVLGGYLPLVIAGPAGSILKFVPGIGIAAGVLAQSTLAGATTYAVGKLFIEHFETGGTLLDVKPTEMAKKLKKAVQEGKAMLKEKRANAA